MMAKKDAVKAIFNIRNVFGTEIKTITIEERGAGGFTEFNAGRKECVEAVY